MTQLLSWIFLILGTITTLCVLALVVRAVELIGQKISSVSPLDHEQPNVASTERSKANE